MHSVITIVVLVVIGFSDAKPSMRAFPKFFNSRIIGGESANRTEFPWQLSQQRQGPTLEWSHSCGGSLLSNNRSLTAAHCVEGANVNILRVIAGLHQRSNMTGTITSNCIRYVIHPDYNSPDATFANDIAIVHLDQAIEGNGETIQFARLPSPNSQYNSDCIISGWGRDSSTTTLPDTLQKASIQALQNINICRLQFAGVAVSLWDRQICVYDANNVVGSCNGDDGGPLNCNPTGMGALFVAGIASWGITGALGDCMPNYPSVYTATQPYAAWIGSN